MKQKLSRQDIFETVWNYYIVEGMPFCVKENEWGFPEPRINTSSNKSPMALVEKLSLHPHVDKDFLLGLQAAHIKAVRFVFNNVNIKRIKDFYSRAYRRTFRKTMKYFLIHFAIDRALTIPSEMATRQPALRLAAKNKR